VVVLIAWEDLSYAETAQALGIPVGTVRSRLHRARAALRTALAASGRTETFEEILSHD
jgi:RNA polymerase sigma-70 factor (ECF subfamily)